MRPVSVCVLPLLLAGSALGQPVISAKAGILNHTEGKVLLDGKEVQLKLGVFPQVKKNHELRTEEGRAEMLLGPGVFLRLAENGSVRMISDDVVDTRLEFLGGSMLLECVAMGKDSKVTLDYKGALILIHKVGVYRLDGEPVGLKVHSGEATVIQSGQRQTVRRARQLPLNGVSAPEEFDAKTGDALYRWARSRSDYLARASLSAAKYASISGRVFWIPGACGGWVWSDYLAQLTFMPFEGHFRSFWGHTWQSARDVYDIYSPPQAYHESNDTNLPSNDRNLGYTPMPQTSVESSGTVAATSAPTASSNASSAPVSRGTSGGGTGGSHR